MKIEVDNITVTLSVHEARIIACFMDHWDSSDPYGETSNELGENINLVVQTCDALRNGLRQTL